MYKQMFLFSVLFIHGLWLSADNGDSLNRKQQKEIQRLFGDGIEISSLHIPSDEANAQSVSKERDKLYELRREQEVLGYLISTKAKGRFDLFDYSVIFSPSLEVEGIVVTEYRSTHGAGICNRRWLEQFRGYTGGELRLGKEIDMISGATLSAGSMVKDVQRCYNLLISVLGLPSDP
jgi:Na+-translocating ferredoxin:NAD+ oxidoreductase RnfG subunit